MYLKHVFLRTLLIGAACGLPVFAYGESQDLFHLSLVELLNIPITGSTHTTETQATVPSAVTVFDRQKIAQLGVETLAQLANLAPGFQVLRSGDSSGYSMISSRGRRIGAVSAEVLVLVDGRRTEDMRQSGVATLLEMPLSNIERVEFIRGPGSALYGSGAMMGVINVITREGARELSLSAGNKGNSRLSFLTALGDDDLGLDFHLDYAYSSGEKYNLPDTFSAEPVDTEDPYRNANILLKGHWHALEAALRYAHQDYEKFYIIDVVDPNVSDYHLSVKDFILRHTGEFGNITSVNSLVIGEAATEITGRSTPPGQFSAVSQPPSDAPFIYNISVTATKWEFENQTHWALNSKNRLTLGGSYRSNELTENTSRGNFSLTEFPFPSAPNLAFEGDIYSLDSESVFGVFGQWQSEIRQQSNLTVGLRFDRYPEIDEQNVSPRFAWVETLNSHNRLKFLYGEAFRAPNIHEMGLASNDFILSNTELRAETVTTQELIWFGNAGKWLWSLGYFVNQFDDAILQVVPPEDPGVRQYRNQSYDSSQGWEGELQVQLSSRWLLGATITKLSTLDDLAYRESQDLASLTVNYANSRWNMNLALAYRGARGNSLSTPNALGDYWLSYAKVQYQLNAAFRLFFLANNLSDETIFFPAQGGNLPRGVPSRGREIKLGIDWAY